MFHDLGSDLSHDSEMKKLINVSIHQPDLQK